MPNVTFTPDNDDSAIFTKQDISPSLFTYTADVDDSSAFTQNVEILVYDLLIDTNMFYIVDSLGTRINLGGGYEIDGDTTVGYTVAV